MHLLACRFEYYVLGSTEVEDWQYDELEKRASAIEKTSPWLRHTHSPTQVPGSDIASSYPRGVRAHHGSMTARVKKQQVVSVNRVVMVSHLTLALLKQKTIT